MIRPLVSVLLVALAAVPAAQIRGSGPSAQDARNPVAANGFAPSKVVRPVTPAKSAATGGVRGAAAAAALPDAAYVAAMRARHELAKANGQLCPIREAIQAQRLAEAEGMLAAKLRARTKAAGAAQAGVRGSK